MSELAPPTADLCNHGRGSPAPDPHGGAAAAASAAAAAAAELGPPGGAVQTPRAGPPGVHDAAASGLGTAGRPPNNWSQHPQAPGAQGQQHRHSAATGSWQGQPGSAQAGARQPQWPTPGQQQPVPSGAWPQPPGRQQQAQNPGSAGGWQQPQAQGLAQGGGPHSHGPHHPDWQQPHGPGGGPQQHQQGPANAGWQRQSGPANGAWQQPGPGPANGMGQQPQSGPANGARQAPQPQGPGYGGGQPSSAGNGAWPQPTWAGNGLVQRPQGGGSGQWPPPQGPVGAQPPWQGPPGSGSGAAGNRHTPAGAGPPQQEPWGPATQRYTAAGPTQPQPHAWRSSGGPTPGHCTPHVGGGEPAPRPQAAVPVIPSGAPSFLGPSAVAAAAAAAANAAAAGDAPRPPPPWLSKLNEEQRAVRERLERAGVNPRGLTAATFHSWCYSILRTYFKTAGFAQCPVVWTDKDLKRAITLAIRLANLERGKVDFCAWLGLAGGTDWASIFREAEARHPDVWARCVEEALKLEAKALPKKRKAKASPKRQRKGASAATSAASSAATATTTAAAGQARPTSSTAGTGAPAWAPRPGGAAADPGGPSAGPGVGAPGAAEGAGANGGAAADGEAAAAAQQPAPLEQRMLYRAEFIKLLYKQLRDKLHIKGEEELGARPTKKQVTEALAWLDCTYTHLLRSANAVDFNDMLLLVGGMLKDHRWLLERLQKRHKYVLVDEFQDCSMMQIEMVQLLSRGEGRVTVVGDDAQSIYRFRGSLPDVLRIFQDWNPQAGRTLLELNYRSAPKILAVGEAVLKDGKGEMAAGVLPKTLRPTKPDNPTKVVFIEVGAPVDEAEAITAEIEQLHNEHDMPYSHVAILLRCFKKALRFKGIPFVLVQDTLAYLRLALNPADDSAFSRIYNTPPRRLGDVKAKFILYGLCCMHLAGAGDPDAVAEARAALGGGEGLSTLHRNGVQELIEVVERLRSDLWQLGPAGAVARVLELTGYAAWWSKQKRNKENKADKAAEALAVSPGGVALASRAATADALGKQEAPSDSDDDDEEDAAKPTGLASPATPSTPRRRRTAGRGAAREGSDDDSDDDDDDDGEDEEADGEAAGEGAADDDSLLPPLPRGLRAEPRQLSDADRVMQGVRCLFEEAGQFAARWRPHGEHVFPAHTEEPPPEPTPGADHPGAPHAAGAGPAPAAAQAAHGQAEPVPPPAEAPPPPERTGVPELFQLAARAVLERFDGEEVLAKLNSVSPRTGLPLVTPCVLEQLYGEHGRGPMIMRDFLAHVALCDREVESGGAGAAAGSSARRPSVTISTIHAAKGLEWPTVFVARWADGFLPTLARMSKAEEELLQCKDLGERKQAIEQDRELHAQEERRLAHVAVTRAKERLYLTSIRVVSGSGKTWRVAPSSIRVPADPDVLERRTLPVSEEETKLLERADRDEERAEMYGGDWGPGGGGRGGLGGMGEAGAGAGGAGGGRGRGFAGGAAGGFMWAESYQSKMVAGDGVPKGKAEGGMVLAPSRADLNKMFDAVTDGERDNYKLITKLSERMQRVGLTMPGIEVRWTNLRVELTEPPKPISQAVQRAASATGAHLGGSGSKSLSPSADPGNSSAAPAPTKPKRTGLILDAGSGVVRPGRMTLLLGPPGSGRSTLLKALAGQLVPPTEGAASAALAAARCVGRGADPAAAVVRRHGRIKVQGSVLYNGKPADGSAFEVTRAATYVGQTENHLPELTVAETLTFAAECQGHGVVKRLIEIMMEREAAAGVKPHDEGLEALLELARGPAATQGVVQSVARMLAIDDEHVMDTVVGNEMLKGISGGQKRRVTVGEMAVGLSNVMMMDEITNGLDAQSALAIVRSLRNMCEQGNVTILAALLQPSPEVVSCFHDVLLLSAGRIVFHGPVEALQGFFGGLGLAPLPQQTLADFAQEVVATPEDQARFRVQALPGAPVPAWTGHKWVSPKRIRRRYEESEEGRAQAALVAQPPYTHELEELVLRKSKYGTSTWRMWATVLGREALLWKRGKLYLATVLIGNIANSFLLSTTFVQLKHSTMLDANLFMSVMFFSLMATFMSGFNSTPIFCSRLNVFYKQRDHRFYSPASYAIGNLIMRLPEILISVIVFTIMMYFSVGFCPEPDRFFLQLLNMFAAGLNSATSFAVIAALFRDETMAQGLGTMVMMISVIVSGFPIAAKDIPGWWIWFYWLTPMSWGFRSMLIVELSSSNWPMGSNGLTVGQEALVLRGVYTEWKWVWAGIGYVLGFSALCVVIEILALTFLGPRRSAGAGPDYDHDDEGDELGRSSINVARTSSHRLAHADPLAATAHQPLPGHQAHASLPHTDAAAHYPASGLAPHPLGHDARTLDEAAADLRAQQAQLKAWKTPPSLAGPILGGTNSGSLRARPPSSGSATGGSAHGPGPGPDGAVVVNLGGSGGGAAPAVAGAVVVHGSHRVGASGGGGGGGAGLAAQGSLRAVTEGGMMAFRPVVMAFKDVCYFVTPSEAKEELQLLDRVSGVFEPGVLTSLMGASGAGKTTLMDVLAGRKTDGRMTGVQLVNGAPKRMSKFARQMGYVEQVDVHNPFATVEEALIFSARLRVGSDVLPDRNLRQFVRDMMAVVELTPLADRVVGAPGSGGLSTEARKRLTIAVELVANPSIVFMDEPTTGLDGRAAGMVMRAVRNTVATGRTVVCTIHQPNREIMDAFDQLLLLKPGGRTIYSGALGPQQASLVAYLSSLPGVGGYEPHMNPANWMLEVTSPEAETNLGTDFAVAWEQSELGKQAAERVDRFTRKSTAALGAKETSKGRKRWHRAGSASSSNTIPKAGAPGSSQCGPGASQYGSGYGDVELGASTYTVTSAGGAPVGAPAEADGKAGPGEVDPAGPGLDPEAEEVEEAHSIGMRYAQPAWRQLWLLSKRGIVSLSRNMPYNGMRFVITFLVAWALGSLYWGQGSNRTDMVGLANIMGVMFMGSTFISMLNLMMIVPVVFTERAVYYREKASGMYRPAIFAASQGVAEYPYIFLQSVMFVVIVYTTVHFQFTATKALWYWMFLFLSMMSCTFLGMGAMNMARDPPSAIALVSGFILLWMCFCGFLIYKDDIGPWWIWAYYSSPFTWIIYGCVTTQLGDVTNEFITVGSDTMSVASYVETTFGYEYSMRGWIVLILLAFVVTFRVVSYIGLTKLNFQHR
ncbi:hypothetical protein HYH03_009749 [Edaphochlamys debaryana]|uniref:DNA helicase n=1 Tax=Edaphochlamys debaryana TaxID=47281 RepID=A0A835Y3T9_9CHLO|nr:hypothetical protein HYH03_009749 [Edaphochlamys debaryana]|eukprot:KAG2492020.1 hypothetical protein HYH03_009749 [Edaphochlamys debaryana]